MKLSIQMIILACVFLLLFGCSEPTEDEQYIVKSKQWPTDGWYGEKDEN